MRTVLVTGASGFCGMHLGHRLKREAGMRLVGAARSAPPAEGAGPWDEFVPLDVRDEGGVAEVVRSVRPDWIFHLAGLSAGADHELHATNVGGTTALLEAVRAHAPDAAVLLAGSAAEYGKVTPEELPIRETQPCRPTGAYGVAKHAATLAALDHVRRFGTRAVIVRPFNIVGAGVPRSLVVGALIERLRDLLDGGERTLRVGNVDTRRDFVGVGDVVDAYVRILRGGFWGEVVNVCSGEPRTIRSVVESLVRMTGRPISVEVDPSLVRPADVPVSYGSWEKARELVGFVPATSLEQALAAAWESASQG